MKGYVIGGYYFWQIVRGYGATAYGPAAALWNIPTVSSTIGNLALDGFEADSTSTPETRSAALFGQTDFHLTDRLTLTTGLRYTQGVRTGLMLFVVTFYFRRPEWAAGLFLFQYAFGVLAGPIWQAIGVRLGKTRAAVLAEGVQAAINLGSRSSLPSASGCCSCSRCCRGCRKARAT